jgi:hypothetical protein
MTSRVVWSVRIRHYHYRTRHQRRYHRDPPLRTGLIRVRSRHPTTTTLQSNSRSGTIGYPEGTSSIPPLTYLTFVALVTQPVPRPAPRAHTITLTNQRTKSKPNLNNPGPPQPPTTNLTPVVGSLAFFFFFLGTPGKCDTLGRHTTAQQFSSERPSLSLSPPLDNQPTISTTSIKQRQ